jgi:hypothetical protein
MDRSQHFTLAGVHSDSRNLASLVGFASSSRRCSYLPFGVANAGQFGNEQRNSIDGPAFGSLDAAVDKSFSLNESTKLLFRAEAFNVTNRANFILPIDDINSPVFGQIVEAQAPRVFQFALKLQR